MYKGDFTLGQTIRRMFPTANGSGATVAPSSALTPSDFRIYKDGAAAEKTTTNGITVTSPFDSTVGLHIIEVDTSNSTGDTGFWAAGSDYTVVYNSAKTVDSQVVTGFPVLEFSIQNRYVLPATSIRDAILNRALAGNHDTNGTPGKFLQNLDAAVSSISAGSGVNEATVRDIIAAVLPPGLRTSEGTFGRTIPTKRIGYDWEFTVTFGPLTNGAWSKAIFTIKANLSDPDSKAILQLVHTPAISGWGSLRIISGKAASNTEDDYGKVEITDTATGAATVTIKAAATLLIAPQTVAYFDTKRIMADGSIPDAQDGGKLTIIQSATKGSG